MNYNIKPVTGLIAGAVITLFHIYEEERTIPPDSMCRYFLPISTDIGAWIVGLYVLFSGFQHDNGLLAMCGSMIVSIHMAHYGMHKVTSRLHNRIS